jgi:hypothetical protein
MEQHMGGSATTRGDVRAQAARDLGDLRTRPRERAVPFGYRVKNFLQHRHRHVGAVAGMKLLGRLGVSIVFQPALHALRFSPDPAQLGLTPVAWARVLELLRQNVPIAEIPRVVPGAERWAQLQALLRENVFAPELVPVFGGGVANFGLLSERKVTTAGVAFFVDAWQNILEMEIMKYHGVGTGTNAEDNTDTALQTESTTALNPDSTRATGSLTEGASANIFRTVGTVTFDGSAAITEHGIFSQAATGGGTLWDRSVFSAINVASADSIQFTYDLTASAEA